MPTEIVIAGAGYAGVSAYLDLARHAGREDYRVTVVNLERYHVFTTELHSLAVGRADAEDVTVPLDRLVRAPHRLHVGEATHVDTERRVLTVDGRPLPFDLLVLAVGSVTEDYGIPGVHRHAMMLTDVRSARRIRARLSDLADRAYGSVVIVGGGLTGVELAAEIRETFGTRLTVEVVEAGPELMAGIDPPLVAAARRLLDERGVGVRTSSPVAAVEEGALAVRRRGRTDPPTTVPFDALIWAAGVRGHPLVAAAGLTVDRKGRGYVDAYLRSRDAERLFLAGDCAAFPVRPGQMLPPTAQAAEQAGRHVADNLRRTLQMRPLEPFAPRIRGFFASLGEWQGVGELGREQFVGLPAIMVKRLVEAHHAFEAGGMHSLLRRLLRHGGRLLWGTEPVERSRRALHRSMRRPQVRS
jgi:NADH dehydrogenase